MLEARIDSQDFLAQLADEIVIDYTADDDTITVIVTALLAFQAHANPVTLGTIQPVVSRSVAVEQDSLLKVLMSLRDTVGGYIEVDTDRKLNWWDDVGEDKGQQIRFHKNLKGITRSMDFSNFGNKLYCYGAGMGDARIKLSDADGHSEDYVESANGSVDTYGLSVRQLVDKSITHPDTLLAWALLKLAEMEIPRISYSVDMANLEFQEGFSFEALQLGSTVKVIDEDLSIDVSARVVKIIRDLTDPLSMTVEISNKVRDILDTLSGVYDTQQFEGHIATKIGAGQVIVLGAFTVIDWVTEGETTIVGSHIETGTITAAKLDVSELSAITANMGTLTSGSIKVPSTGWRIEISSLGSYPLRYWDGETDKFIVDNAGNVTVTGTIYALAGEFTGTLKATTLQAGKTLTVAGSVSIAGGSITLDDTGITIFGDFLKFKAAGGGAALGSLFATGDHVEWWLTAGGLKVYGGPFIVTTELYIPAEA